jgi:hypothetical protein
MGLPHERYDIAALLKSVKDKKDWVTEVSNLVLLIEALNELGKSTSARDLSKLVQQSKSWVGVSLVIAKGLKTYPEIVKCRNRNEAYLFLQKKNKMRRFLES